MTYFLLVSLSLVAACLTFTLILTLLEARKVKCQLKIDSARKRTSFQVLSSTRLRKHSSDLEEMYDKINPDYLATNQDMVDCRQVYREDSFHVARTESFQSVIEGPTNAELILRELFVPTKAPIKEEASDNSEADNHQLSKRERIKSRIRRYTSEIQSESSQYQRKFSAKSNRSSLSHRDSTSSFSNSTTLTTADPAMMLMMMSRSSTGSVLDEKVLMNQRRPRRQALVFTTQISLIGDNNEDVSSSNYSTIV